MMTTSTVIHVHIYSADCTKAALYRHYEHFTLRGGHKILIISPSPTSAGF